MRRARQSQGDGIDALGAMHRPGASGLRASEGEVSLALSPDQSSLQVLVPSARTGAAALKAPAEGTASRLGRLPKRGPAVPFDPCR